MVWVRDRLTEEVTSTAREGARRSTGGGAAGGIIEGHEARSRAFPGPPAWLARMNAIGTDQWGGPGLACCGARWWRGQNIMARTAWPGTVDLSPRGDIATGLLRGGEGGGPGPATLLFSVAEEHCVAKKRGGVTYRRQSASPLLCLQIGAGATPSGPKRHCRRFGLLSNHHRAGMRAALGFTRHRALLRHV